MTITVSLMITRVSIQLVRQAMEWETGSVEHQELMEERESKLLRLL
jgi:hypothetical protein